MDTYQLLPDLSETDYRRLKSDIRDRGQVLVPIVVDEDGQVLDGHHRLRAVRELEDEGHEIDMPPAQVRRDLPDHEKYLLAGELNLARRQLTDAQRVIVGEKLEDHYKERARQRQGTRNDLTSGSNEPEVVNRSRDEVADAVGLGSGSTYERGKKTVKEVEEEAPDLVEDLESGVIDLRDARKKLKQKRREKKREQKRERAAAAGAQSLSSTDRRYAVIYADPPWSYEFSATTNREIENHYQTMPVSQIIDLPIPAADDSVLFLWATNPKLRDALAVMDGWGFDYVTSMVWVKDRIGMGYYARQRHEPLLIGKRGALPTPDPANRPDSVIEAPRREHSAKPVEVYELLESMYPGLPKIELFARSRRDGWDVWGDEVPS